MAYPVFLLEKYPTKGKAFIWVRTVQEGMLSAHLQECISLCRMAGAEQILAGNHPDLERFPVYTKLLEMCGTVNRNPERVAFVRPVTEKTAGEWRGTIQSETAQGGFVLQLWNSGRKQNFQTPALALLSGTETCLASGWLEEDTIRAVASWCRVGENGSFKAWQPRCLTEA